MFEGTDSVFNIIKSEFNLPTQCKPTDLTNLRAFKSLRVSSRDAESRTLVARGSRHRNFI
jgi:hypothetical protein